MTILQSIKTIEKELEKIKNLSKEKPKKKTKTKSKKIGNKTFTILRPEPNGKDIFAWPEWYEHIRYIKGTAITREAKKAGKKLFENKQQIEEFLETHITGETRIQRIQNFTDLMGLEKSGYRHSDGDWLGLRVRGFAWLSDSDHGRAYELGFSDGDANVYRSNLGIFQPVVCFD